MKQHPEHFEGADLDKADDAILDTKLSTNSLVLRFVKPEDQKKISAALTEDVASRWLPDAMLKAPEPSIYKLRRIAQEKTLLDLVAIDKKQDTLVGRCGIYPDSKIKGKYELSLWVSSESRRKQYATEMLTALMDWVHEHREKTGIQQLVFSVIDGNAAAEKLARKIDAKMGFRHIETDTVQNGEETKNVTRYSIRM